MGIPLEAFEAPETPLDVLGPVRDAAARSIQRFVRRQRIRRPAIGRPFITYRGSTCQPDGTTAVLREEVNINTPALNDGYGNCYGVADFRSGMEYNSMRLNPMTRQPWTPQQVQLIDQLLGGRAFSTWLDGGENPRRIYRGDGFTENQRRILRFLRGFRHLLRENAGNMRATYDLYMRPQTEALIEELLNSGHDELRAAGRDIRNSREILILDRRVAQEWAGILRGERVRDGNLFRIRNPDDEE